MNKLPVSQNTTPPFTVETATVYRATGGRRYFTKKSAIRGYAMEKWKTKHPCECEGPEQNEHGYTYGGYNCGIHDAFDRVFPRYLRFITRALRAK